jgi:hypothetical protein
MINKISTILMLLATLGLNAQNDTTRVLFIGNSYTSVNNLPNEFVLCANSAGFNVSVASSAPGGYTFQQHLSNASTQGLIQQGNWDFTILQEQSQIPSFPLSQVESECFPFAASLNDSIEKYSPCGETVFYQTWGRQNGDSQNCASWPPVCTYEGMDSLLRERYQMMADMNEAIVSPVGAVRRYLREYYPQYNLYSADGSHPSPLGTYAAACTFTSALFRINPDLITYSNTFTTAEVLAVKEAINSILFNDLLTWNIGEYDVNVQFTYTLENGVLTTNASCQYCDSLVWNFGNGEISNELNTIYQYPTPGIYSLLLTGYRCEQIDSQYAEIFIENIVSTAEHNNLSWNVIVLNNNLYFSQHSPLMDILIFDSMGKMIPTHASNPLSTLGWSAGIYFVLNKTNGDCIKIIIN